MATRFGGTDKMSTNVVAFVGENENGILADLARSFMSPLNEWGMQGHVIDLYDPTWPLRLQALTSQGISFAWGSAGIGSGLRLGEDSLWDTLHIPFISVLADTPCQLPANHHVASCHVANGYSIADWLDVQRRFVRSPQISAYLPGAVPANSDRDLIPWRSRPHRMVFVKTGDDPALYLAAWKEYPVQARRILHEASEEAMRHEPMEITALVQDVALAHGLFLETRPEVLFALARQVDLHLRALRASAVARALLPLGAIIIGRGWDHLDREGARAAIHPAIPAAELVPLYARTQFLVNTTPNFARGTHERPVNAFAARACAVSDTNAFMRERFSPIPTFLGLDWTAPDLPDRLATIFYDPTERDTDPALALAERDFGPEGFMRRVAELAEVVRATAALDQIPGLKAA